MEDDRMNNCILFSPVGTTDPIAGGHDGALLHICRKYRPQKIYLYLSKEIMEYRDMDDRYRYCLNKLADQLGTRFEIIEIERPDLEEVHLFDHFYYDFQNELTKIRKENPDAQILLNVSSGTPAMKSALQVMSALDENEFLAIQVGSPNKSSNPKKFDIRKYELDEEWECNCDNEDDYEDRSVKSSHLNLIAKFKKEMILKHLLVYDYKAALSIAEDIQDHISGHGMLLLRAAVARLQLDKSEMDKILQGTSYLKEIIPVQGGDERNIMEFLLWLQIKLDRGDYADFIRGITPVIADLLERILKKRHQIDIRDYCENRTYRDRGFAVSWLTRSKLSSTPKGQEMLQILDEYYQYKYNKPNAEFRDTPFTSDQLTALAERYSSEPSFKKRIAAIRDVEERIRNLAAHEIVSITPQWIENKCSLSPSSIMEKIRQLAADSMMNIKSGDWNSYKEMNELIRQNL